MEARAHQRSNRKKEIEELKRKKEQEKLVRRWQICVVLRDSIFIYSLLMHAVVSVPDQHLEVVFKNR